MLRAMTFIAAAMTLSACSWFGTPASTPDSEAAANSHSADAKKPGSDQKKAREAIRFENLRATPAERAKCEAAGGEVVMAGLRGGDICVRPYSDAGEACMDSADCEGMCFAVGEYPGIGEKTTAGQCAPNDNIFGCRTTVTNGRADGTLCVD